MPRAVLRRSRAARFPARPIPLNLVLRNLRRLWLWARHGEPSRIETLLECERRLHDATEKERRVGFGRIVEELAKTKEELAKSEKELGESLAMGIKESVEIELLRRQVKILMATEPGKS